MILFRLVAQIITLFIESEKPLETKFTLAKFGCVEKRRGQVTKVLVGFSERG